MSIYSQKQFRFKKSLKRKVFLSNELKSALLIAFMEAKKHKVYVTSELLLYGLISQSNSIAAKLIETTISEFRNNKNLTSTVITNRIRQINNETIEEKFKFDLIKPNKFSDELWDENRTRPWLSPEVKQILKTSIQSSLQSNKKITVVSTKHILFELLKKEFICKLFTQVTQVMN